MGWRLWCALHRGRSARLEIPGWSYDQGEELKVFATEDATRAWFEENDPAGVAFEYEVLE
jgi:hypothetical protein